MNCRPHTRPPHWLRLFLLMVLLAGAGCATQPAAVSDQLFFGRSMPGGGEVTDAQWHAFVAEVVVPRFPDGFTVWPAHGHWRDDDGVSVNEQTFVLEVVHPNDATSAAKLEDIARIYRRRFQQDAVLQVSTPAKLTFWWY